MLLLSAAAQPPVREVYWSWDPWVGTSIVIAAVWYAAGVRRLRRRLGAARLLGHFEVGCFAAGLGAIAVALLSPIDSIAGQLFWVHMVQHLLLMLAAAPLLVAGRPAVAFLWGFKPRGRKRLGRAWMALGLRSGIAGLMHPVVVWLLFCGAFVFWHLPLPYQSALRNDAVHTAEHLSLLVTALMFWSIVIEPSGRRRLGYGATLLFVMTVAILSGLPGALIALAPRALYPAYGAGPAAWGLTPLQDQQLAGAVMWIPGGAVYVVAATIILFKWLTEEGSARAAAFGRAAASLLVLAALPLLLAGCGNGDRDSATARIGDAHRGVAVIRAEGCGGCHTIPGVDDADGVVGPPLGNIGRRIYIAGMLRNTPDNMVAWLRDPQRVVPGNVMPDMGLSEQQARDVAAYLFTLR